MARTRRRMACTITKLVICGTIAVSIQAQSSFADAPAGAMKKSQDAQTGSIHGAPKFPIAGEFQSAPALFRQGKFAEAERQFAWIAQVRKGTTWGERSQYYVAECQYQQKKYIAALASWDRLLIDYPATNYRDQVIRREYEIAQLWITWDKPAFLPRKKAFLLPLFEIAPLRINTDQLAFWALCAIRQADPAGPLADRAHIKIAGYYMMQCDYDSAAAYYDLFLAEYPRSPLCPRARLGALEARLRIYLLNHHDAAGLKMARELAQWCLRAFLNFDDHLDAH
jgi:tetratricopeptide (TPR) repeat protein